MYKAIAANKRNTALIMSLFVALVGAIGWAVSYYYGDSSIAIYVIVIAAIYAVIQYFVAASLVLTVTGAKVIAKKDNPRLYRIVENLSIATGLPMPKVCIIDDPALNAFATGRDPRHATVAATTGLINNLSDSELEAVMAHEMGHVQNYDIRVSMIVFGLVSIIGIISDIVMRMFIFGDRDSDNRSPLAMIIGIVVIILAPVMAFLIQMAVSRQREYLADATGAMTTRHPEALASALEKIDKMSRPMKRQSSSTAHLFIANPLKKGFMSKLFSTHPPVEERVKRLEKNANKF